MRFESVREAWVRRTQHQQQQYQAYRSHPSSTNPANPCIESAKANTSAASSSSIRQNAKCAAARDVSVVADRPPGYRAGQAGDRGSDKGDDRGVPRLTLAIEIGQDLSELRIDRP